MRGFLCQAFALSIRKAAVWRTDSEFAHLPLPFALWRRLYGSQRAAEGTECGRLGAGDEPFALLRAQPAAHPLYRLGNLYQGFATSATNGSGGCGGTFAPSLIIGGFAGFLFARLWNVNQVGVYVPEQNFTLMGMAGLITGVMHAPLTGIFLIAELTGGYQLFMPLMIVCISSLLTISIFESHSIYALRLAREGKLLTHHIDKAALTLLGMQDVIEKDYHPVGSDLPMSKLVSEISRSNNNFLPVLDQAGVLLGVIDITKIRHIIFRTELYQHFTVRQLMMQPAAVLTEHDSMDEVMQKFDKTDAAQLPVVDVAGVLKGYISRTRIYSMYRQIVADMSAE